MTAPRSAASSCPVRPVRPARGARRGEEGYRRPAVLDAVRRRFLELASAEVPLTVDGAAAGGGLPPSPIPIGELAVVLLHPSVNRDGRDAALAAVILQGRAATSMAVESDRPAAQPDAAQPRAAEDWQLVLLGLLMPGLLAAARRLARSFPTSEVEDLGADLLAGVLAALPDFEVAEGRVAGRLLARGMVAARRAARADRLARADLPLGSAPAAATSDGVPEPGEVPHPDFLLGLAVADGAVTAAEAALIGRTRLEDQRMRDVAAAVGATYPAVRRRRVRAEARLVAWLAARALD